MRVLLLLLIPNLAFAVQTCEFEVPTSKKINEPALLTAIQAQEPSVTLQVIYGHGDLSIEGVIQAGTAKDTKVIVDNVPDNYTCNQVESFLQNHNPAQSTFEENASKALQNKINKLDELLPQTPTIQDILSRLDALEGG